MRLAVIAGDGIGPEVIDEALKVLDEVVPGVEKTNYDLGAARYHATGEVLPESVLERAAASTTRSCSAPSATRRCPAACSSAACCCGCGSSSTTTSTCARPGCTRGAQPAGGQPRHRHSSSCARAPRARTPAPAALLRKDTPHEIATEVSIEHRVRRRAGGARRVRARASAAAQAPDAGAQDQRADLRRARCGRGMVEEVSLEYPDVEVAYQHIDAATIHMVTDPGRFDVIVTDNLFGDIITDLAAAVSGGIGLAASGNIDVEPDATRRCSSRCTAARPDIAGQGIADPTAAIMSVALLLDHLGHTRGGRPHRGRGGVRPGDPRPPGHGPHPVDRRPPGRPGQPPGRSLELLTAGAPPHPAVRPRSTSR